MRLSVAYATVALAALLYAPSSLAQTSTCRPPNCAPPQTCPDGNPNRFACGPSPSPKPAFAPAFPAATTAAEEGAAAGFADTLAALGATLALRGDTPDTEDLCRELLQQVASSTRKVQSRYNELLENRQGLFTKAYDKPVPGLKGTWIGHVDAYNQARNALSRRISSAERNRCQVPQEAYHWRDQAPPSAPDEN